MPSSPRLLIADDEPALADNLIDELAALWPEATLQPAVHDGQSVLDVIDDAAPGQGPDVVFLDIRMPGLSGIDVARELSNREERPLVVFVTAYDQFALDAFEQAAVDYVLKPVQAERLAETVKRLQALDRLGQALGLHGLEHVVDGGLLERVQRELVVGGDEHHQRALLAVRQLARHVDARQPRHADVQENHVRPLPRRRIVDHVEHRLPVMHGRL